MEIKVLGDYQVIKQIGQGALGTVFLAEHRFIKKHYMLKVLPEELATDRAFISRFQAEVTQLATLDHPGLVKMHNVSYAQGAYFLVNDCVVDELGETTNLAQYLLAHPSPLSEKESLHLLRQVAEALDYTHNKRVIHRGLKLNNILVGATKPEVQVQLCDFGLSSIVGEAAMMTRTYRTVAETLGIGAQVFGGKIEQDKYSVPPIENNKLIPLHQSFIQSFAFLAPEQKRIDRTKPIDAKTDAYAFGILAYYLLTLQFPEGYFDMPSVLEPRLSKGWDLLIARCLSVDVTKRPEGLVDALEEYVIQGKTFVGRACTVPPVLPSKTLSHVVLQQPVAAEAAAELAPEPRETATARAPQPVLQASRLILPEVDENPSAAFQVDSAVKHYQQPVRAETKEVIPLQTEMVVIQGGEYYRGSSDGNRDEGPKHKIILSSFAIDIHPVTNEQFVRFLEVMGGEKDHHHQDLIRLKDSRIKRAAGKLSIESGYAKHPVVGVTWYGAVAYARWVGKRLPTEAEWEVTARGGKEDVLYPTGEDIEKSQANFFSADTTPVFSYAPNGYGIYDVAGNVYEWCHDWYGYNYYESSVQEPENPRGPLQGVYRVLRGGCWKSLKEDLRCSRRHRNNPGTVNSTYGFRCVADVG